MPSACGHLLCELIAARPDPRAPTGDASCSLATGRSRGCRPGLAPRTIAPAVFDEVRELLAVIEGGDEGAGAAARRLAAIYRREARDDRNLVAQARDDEPELAPALARLCLRRR